jgi:hypothetical protein
MCDPEEIAEICVAGATLRDSPTSANDMPETDPTGIDPMSGVLLFALLLIVATRFRAI